jgi:hypothetical protein
MRRTGIAIALVSICACSEKKSSEPAPAPAAKPVSKPADVATLIHDVTEARVSEDPEKAVIAAVAKQCDCKADSIETAAQWIADQVAHATNDEKSALGDALAMIQIWTPPTPAVMLPASTHAQATTGWGVIVMAKDGSTKVGRATRVKLTLGGAEVVEGVEPKDATEVATALQALDPDPTAPNDNRAFEAILTPSDVTGEFDDVDYGALFGEPGPCESGSGAGWGTIGHGRYDAIGHRSSTPRYSVRAVKSRVVGQPVLFADAAAPMMSVFKLLDLEDAALGVQSGARVAAFAMISCFSGRSGGPSLKLEGGADPKTIRDAYEQQARGATSITLRVSDNASYGDVIGALDAVLEAGVAEVTLESAATGATGRIADVPSTRIGQPTITGEYDKATLRRYIKRNIIKIQFCYEKRQLAKPTLAGTVTTQFFIKPDGKVAAANASGVDREVSRCVAEVFKAIEFPKPESGGVQVTQPFTFRPDGGG